MISKTFEVRDKATFIPALAIQLIPTNKHDRYLFARAGYGTRATQQRLYIMLMQIAGGDGQCTSDAHSWRGRGRTMSVAHEYIHDHWDELSSGSVIDVEFIIGETSRPKDSEAVGADVSP